MIGVEITWLLFGRCSFPIEVGCQVCLTAAYTETVYTSVLFMRSLPPQALNTLVISLVHSRLDYCNVMLACLPARDLQRLQTVLNAIVRLVSGLPRHCHTTPMLRDRPWLFIEQGVQYKLCMLVHRCLHQWYFSSYNNFSFSFYFILQSEFLFYLVLVFWINDNSSFYIVFVV